jgi:hypothetical protein
MGSVFSFKQVKPEGFQTPVRISRIRITYEKDGVTCQNILTTIGEHLIQDGVGEGRGMEILRDAYEAAGMRVLAIASIEEFDRCMYSAVSANTSLDSPS